MLPEGSKAPTVQSVSRDRKDAVITQHGSSRACQPHICLQQTCPSRAPQGSFPQMHAFLPNLHLHLPPSPAAPAAAAAAAAVRGPGHAHDPLARRWPGWH